MLKIGSIVIRCYEFEKMMNFWKGALHYESREPAKDGWVVLTDPQKLGPNISLEKHQINVKEKEVGCT